MIPDEGMPVTLRAATDSDRPCLRAFMRDHWGGEILIARGRRLYPAEHPAFLAENAGEIVGVITYCISQEECEVTSLESVHRERGIGSALMAAVVAEAKSHACRRLWLITTNDNLNALRFYQKRGFQLVALYAGAVESARELKPAIPVLGESGIPIRDELELELTLHKP